MLLGGQIREQSSGVQGDRPWRPVPASDVVLSYQPATLGYENYSATFAAGCTAQSGSLVPRYHKPSHGGRGQFSRVTSAV